MSAYRDGFGPMAHRRAEIAEVASVVEARADALDRVLARRIGRISGALVGLVGLVVTAALVFASVDSGDDRLAIETWAFFGSALAALTTGWLTTRSLRAARWVRERHGARQREAAKRAEALRTAADVVALDAEDPWPRLSHLLGRLEGPSIALPLIAASFFLPLTAHALVYFPASLVDGPADPATKFAAWIMMSGLIVGHAHVALACCGVSFARRMSRLATVDLAMVRLSREAWRAWWISVLVAAIPGVLFLAVPPILTALTGVLVIPLMLGIALGVVKRERAVTDEAHAAVAAVRVGVEEIEAAQERFAHVRVDALGVGASAPADDAEPCGEIESDRPGRTAQR